MLGSSFGFTCAPVPPPSVFPPRSPATLPLVEPRASHDPAYDGCVCGSRVSELGLCFLIVTLPNATANDTMFLQQPALWASSGTKAPQRLAPGSLRLPVALRDHLMMLIGPFRFSDDGRKAARLLPNQVLWLCSRPGLPYQWLARSGSVSAALVTDSAGILPCPCRGLVAVAFGAGPGGCTPPPLVEVHAPAPALHTGRNNRGQQG